MFQSVFLSFAENAQIFTFTSSYIVCFHASKPYEILTVKNLGFPASLCMLTCLHRPPDDTLTLPPHLRPHHSLFPPNTAYNPYARGVPSQHAPDTTNPYTCVVPSQHCLPSLH
ncbi:hypothetical protein O181_018695 [Austropuccinia psidii MF-1]|uniref:Uncharacterized protein n=1 Tax=Austropuccinia psidii MF-1 TaxID=1389203 RepID=A0A9Q3CAB2_9BASI|nr:hypothetical protein [Austropuccinia psidii MF-1]